MPWRRLAAPAVTADGAQGSVRRALWWEVRQLSARWRQRRRWHGTPLPRLPPPTAPRPDLHKKRCVWGCAVDPGCRICLIPWQQSLSPSACRQASRTPAALRRPRVRHSAGERLQRGSRHNGLVIRNRDQALPGGGQAASPQPLLLSPPSPEPPRQTAAPWIMASCRGGNTAGQLGSTVVSSSAVPMAVGGDDLSFSMLSAGSLFTCGTAPGNSENWCCEGGAGGGGGGGVGGRRGGGEGWGCCRRRGSAVHRHQATGSIPWARCCARAPHGGVRRQAHLHSCVPTLRAAPPFRGRGVQRLRPAGQQRRCRLV